MEYAIKNIKIKHNYINEEPEITRISNKNYNNYKKLAIQINKRTEDINESNHELRFVGKNHFPSVKELEDHHVKYDVRKYLPTLLFYDTIELDNKSDEYKETKEYIKHLLENYVEIINDKDVKAINKLSKRNWSEYDVDRLVKVFKPLLKHYKKDEFNTFILDLKWKKFMTLEKYTSINYVSGYMPDVIYNKLSKIWKKYFE